MPDATAQGPEPAVDYVIRLLDMNPASDPAEIVRARSERVGHDKLRGGAPAAISEQPHVERRKLVEHLGVIRREFWRMPIDSLGTGLAMLDGHGYADIDAATTRLRLIAAKRTEISKLVAKPGFDMAFFDALKDVLVRSPREAAIVKEQTLASFRNRSRRNAGRRMIQMLERELPGIYAMDTEWLAALKRQRAEGPKLVIARKSAMSTSTQQGSTHWIVWVIIGILIQVVRLLFQGTR